MKKKAFDYEERFMCPVAKKPESYFRTFNQDYRLRSLVKAVSLTKGWLLDVGCGGGIATESFPYYFPKMEIYGCDVSRTAITHAKKYGSGKIKYDQIKNKRLPYKSNYFDLAVCNDVLEHVPDPHHLLKEIRRVLKNGGKLFIVVPCEGQPLTYTWIFQKLHLGESLTYQNFGHIHPEYTHQSVIKMLEDRRFNIDDVAYSEHLLYQLNHLLIFFIPKLVLELIFGKKKVAEYSYSSLYWLPKTSKDPLMLMRNLWVKLRDFLLMYPMYWETIIFRKIPFTAWKLQILVSKK